VYRGKEKKQGKTMSHNNNNNINCVCHLYNPVTNNVVQNTAKNRQSIIDQVEKHISKQWYPDWKNTVNQCKWQFGKEDERGFSEAKCTLEDRLAVDGNKVELVLKRNKTTPDQCTLIQRSEGGWGAGTREVVWEHQIGC
jgi:methenyltetrahydromethanopterin cyclohydrolase